MFRSSVADAIANLDRMALKSGHYEIAKSFDIP